MNESPEIFSDFNKETCTRLTSDDFEIIIDKKDFKLWILHDKPFIAQSKLERAEYNADDGIMTFIDKDGLREELSVDIKATLHSPIRKATEITVLHTKDGTILDIHVLPFQTV